MDAPIFVSNFIKMFYFRRHERGEIIVGSYTASL